ncbi:hypothetical protein TRFO_42160 [Tritrichomonas foetus]|uniref:Uncharacterized protein n=1 Tax=Tritrichomonas foetus TaxID=1144522 RepID=A0A1J4KXS2_9EUKA|nr:hypothetical protein TRFO_42160 [Tritrichomonas foetus]|eukprot:OHT15978.1 hypothetical protein TRFO_42160 [Tritrichomonas foetus]
MYIWSNYRQFIQLLDDQTSYTLNLNLFHFIKFIHPKWEKTKTKTRRKTRKKRKRKKTRRIRTRKTRTRKIKIRKIKIRKIKRKRIRKRKTKRIKRTKRTRKTKRKTRKVIRTVNLMVIRQMKRKSPRPLKIGSHKCKDKIHFISILTRSPLGKIRTSIRSFRSITSRAINSQNFVHRTH